MTLTELADRVGVTVVNLSVLKNGRARAIRFSTLAASAKPSAANPATCSATSDSNSAYLADPAWQAYETHSTRPARKDAGRRRGPSSRPTPTSNQRDTRQRERNDVFADILSYMGGVRRVRVRARERTGTNAGRHDLRGGRGPSQADAIALQGIDMRADFTRNGRSHDLILDLAAHRSALAYKGSLVPGGRYLYVGGSAATLLQVLLMGPLLGRAKGKKLRLLAVRSGAERLGRWLRSARQQRSRRSSTVAIGCLRCPRRCGISAKGMPEAGSSPSSSSFWRAAGAAAWELDVAGWQAARRAMPVE